MQFEKHKDKIIIFLLVVVAGLLFYIILNQNKSAALSERDTMRLRAQIADSGKSGKDVDPYEKNEVKNTILKGAADNIQNCFKTWIKNNPAFDSGRVSIDWQIELDGSVKSPQIVTSEIPAINDCVVDAIQKLQFPPPPSDRPWYVVHKFLFKKEEEPKPASTAPSQSTEARAGN